MSGALDALFYNTSTVSDPYAGDVVFWNSLDNSLGSNIGCDFVVTGTSYFTSTNTQYGSALNIGGYPYNSTNIINSCSSTDFNLSGDFTVQVNGYKNGVPECCLSDCVYSFLTIVDYNGNIEYVIGALSGTNKIGYAYPISINTIEYRYVTIDNTNTWFYTSLTRSSGTYKFYVNGLLVDTYYNSYTRPDGPRTIYIGSNPDGTCALNGMIDEVLITNGVARNITPVYTPPTVTTGVPPIADFIPNPIIGVPPLLVTFTDTSTNNPTQWLWDFDNNSDTSTQENTTYTYSNVGTYNPILTVANAYGNDSTTRGILTISVGLAPLAGFTFTPNIGAAALSVAFTDTSTQGPTAWAWSFGDGNTSTVQNPTNVYVNPGTYTPSLTVSNAFGSDSTTNGTVIVGLPPIANFSVNPAAGSAPLGVNFTDLSTRSPTAWSWSFGDSATSSVQNPSHTYTNPGTYTPSLTASNAFGSSNATNTVVVVPGILTAYVDFDNAIPNPPITMSGNGSVVSDPLGAFGQVLFNVVPNTPTTFTIAGNCSKLSFWYLESMGYVSNGGDVWTLGYVSVWTYFEFTSPNTFTSITFNGGWLDKMTFYYTP